MRYNFSKKVALVTGAASRIGAAIAAELAVNGARVVIADRDAIGAASVAATIHKAGGTAAVFEIDITDSMAVEAMVGFAEKTYGALHLAVNNAGIDGPSAPTGEYTLDGWQHVIDINLPSVFHCMRHEIAAMQRAGGGAIVNMAPILGSIGFARSSTYVAAKHGVVGLTKAAALEYATRGIRITAVGPGFTDAPLLPKHLDESPLQHCAGPQPIDHLGRSKEVASLTCFLLSEQASFITGSYHVVEGAYAAQ